MPTNAMRVAFASPTLEVAQTIARPLAKFCGERGMMFTLCGGNNGCTIADLYQFLSDIGSDLSDTMLIIDVGSAAVESLEVNRDEGSLSYSYWERESGRSHEGSTIGLFADLFLRFPHLYLVAYSDAFVDELAHNDTLDHVVRNLLADTPSITALPEKYWQMLRGIHFSRPSPEATDLLAKVRRFGHAFRTFFDPTGLRTLFRNQLLRAVFGISESNEGAQDPSFRQRELLGLRLRRTLAVVEEEAELSALHCYTGYKYGNRCWMVSTYEEFSVHGASSWRSSPEMLVIRDLDLRFPDIWSEPSGDSPYELLSDVTSHLWNRVSDSATVRGVRRDGRLRPVSSKWAWEEERLGKKGNTNNREFLGLRKPMRSLCALGALMQQCAFQPANMHTRSHRPQSILSNLSAVKGRGARHEASPVNLLLATSLIEQSGKLRNMDDAFHAILAALLAQDAAALLVGMSVNIAFDALREVHLAEAQAEARTTALQHNVSIEWRIEDAYESVMQIDHDEAASAFLSRLWSELRAAYRSAELFEAAEDALFESHVHSAWIFGHPESRGAVAIRRMMVWPFRSVLGMIVLFLALASTFCGLYSATQMSNWRLDCSAAGSRNFFDLVIQVLISLARPETLQLHYLRISENWGFQLVSAASSVASMVFIGLTAAFAFRKVTRG